MLVAIYKLLRGDHSAAELVGRNRARQAFLRMNDRLLADAGISRDKLNQGLKAWPWHVDLPESDMSLPLGSAPDSMRAGKAVGSTETGQSQSAVNVDDIAIITAFDEHHAQSQRAA